MNCQCGEPTAETSEYIRNVFVGVAGLVGVVLLRSRLVAGIDAILAEYDTDVARCLDGIERNDGRLPSIHPSPLIRLKKNEELLWSGPASRGKMRKRSVGFTESRVSGRVNVMSGVTLGTQTVLREPIKKHIFETESAGTFLVTSTRLVFVCDDPSVRNWTKTWRSILSRQTYVNAIQVNLTNGSPVFILLKQVLEPGNAWRDARVVDALMRTGSGQT